MVVMIQPGPLPLTLTPRHDIPFLFDSYRELMRDLGAMDGLAAGQTLASKHFLDAAAEHCDPQQFVRDRAVHYRVSTHFVDFPNVPAHLTQLLIVGTTQQAEAFLDKFRREQTEMGRSWRAREDGEQRLKYTLDCISGGFADNRIRVRKERYDLFEYYRVVRNAFVHSSIDRERVQREFEKVSGLRQMVEVEFGLEAPHKVSELTFADHILFTRITKYLATDLCRLAPPLTAHELLSFLLMQPEKPSHPLARILGGVSSPWPYRSGTRSFFKSRYNFDIRNNQESWDELVDWLGKLPNRRQRKELGQRNVVAYAKSVFNSSDGNA